MKIVLPKTLAEPWTIPWFMLSNVPDALSDAISLALREYFDTLDSGDHVPNPVKDPGFGTVRLDPQTLLEALKALAQELGAKDVETAYDHLINGPKHIGYSYRVHFHVPNRRRVQMWVINSWFHWDHIPL